MTRTQPRADVRLRAGPLRCPYCHGDVAEHELESAKVCLACLARHHGDCWRGACAMCGDERLVGATSQAPGLRPGREPFRHYERIKRLGNRLGIVLFVLYFVLMTCGMIFGALDDPMSDELPLSMIPGLLAGVAFTLVLMPLSVLNFFDAVKRSQSDPSCGLLAIGCTLGALFTGGLSGFAYYLRWGREPLPAPPPKRRAPSSDKE